MTNTFVKLPGQRPPADPQEAAEWWFARKMLDVLSSRDAAQFDQWLSVAANAEAYRRLEAFDQDLGAVAAEPEILQMREAALRHQPGFSGLSWRVALPVAASLLLAISLAVFALSRPSPAPSAVEAEAGIPTSERYETRVGEHREVRLSDGSIVTLNTGSLLEVAYTAERRSVRLLHGEAMFKVAHNTAWPFVVTAGDRNVTAVGTAFVVRLDGPAIKVVLVQGKVRIDPLRPVGLARVIPQLGEDELTPGEQLTALEGRPKALVAAADVERSLSWENGQVIFRDDTIETATAELNRYSTKRILVDDPRISALTVSGVFNARRPEDFVAAVTNFYPIEAVHPSADVTELKWRNARS